MKQKEACSLFFNGKEEAREAYSTATDKMLRLNSELSQKAESTRNRVLIGDNLDCLKLLADEYGGKITCIYIDPPYNTGKNDFIYPDNFKNHAAWLAFMYPRLMLARDLLSEEGVIFISIDDNEQAHLKLILDEIFGEENFIATLTVENNPKGRKNSAFIATSSEFVEVYAKHKSSARFVKNIPKAASEMRTDENGHFIHGSGKRVLVGENGYNRAVKDFNSPKHYSVYRHPVSGILITRREYEPTQGDAALETAGFIRYISVREGQFIENTYTENKLKTLYEAGALQFTVTKIFEKNFNDRTQLKSIVKNLKYEAANNNLRIPYKLDLKTTSAGLCLEKLFGVKHMFSSPKSVDLIRLFITLFESRDITVLDFFAGSGTTAHAVMQQNEEDGGTRRFILCQTDDLIPNGQPARQFCIDNALPPVISSVTCERLRRAGRLYEESDTGFQVFNVVVRTK